jgi:hypothetical protein
MRIIKKPIVSFIAMISFSFVLNAQNGIIGSGFGANDWSTTNCWADGTGGTRLYSSTANGTGIQYFRLVTCWDYNYNQWGPSSTTVDYQVNVGSIVGSSEVIQNSTSKAYYINVSSTAHNYIFKTRGGGNPPSNPSFLVFCVQGTTATISGVSHPGAVIPSQTVGITATLNASLSTGQGIYLRYTTDNWTNSTVVEMSGSGTTVSANIPSGANVKDQTVKYYVFSSGNGLTISHSNADFYTINLNNNLGSNYEYTPRAIEWVNLQSPSGGTMMPGGDYVIFARVYVNGVTTQITESSGISSWIGYSTTNSNPSTWDESTWKSAGFNTKTGNNHEYVHNAKNAGLTPGIYYYASRFRYGNGAYFYGGYNSTEGNFWDGVTYVSGILRFGKNSTGTGNWEDDATWDGTAPVSGEHVYIKNGHTITINSNVSVNSVTIETGGTLVMNGNVILTMEGYGSWTNNGTFTAGAGTLALQLNVSTGGTSTSEFNNVTVSGVDVSFSNAVSAINGILNITTGSVLNAPQFREGSTLKYSQGGTYTRVTEWNNPWNVVVANNTSLDMNITAFGGDITVYGNLTVESGSTVDMKNYVNFLIINKNMNLNGTLVLSSQAGGDLKLKGNMYLNSGSTLTFNDRAVFLLGTSSQEITDDVGVTLPYLILDNSSGVVCNDNLIVSKRLTLTSGVLDMQANILTVGFDAANLGEIETTSGIVKGKLRRWFAASTNSTDATGLFPVSLGDYRRSVGIYFTVAPTSGGTIDAEFLDKSDIPVEISEDYNKGLPISNCDGVNVDNIYENGIWKLTTSGITDGTYTIKFNTHGIDRIDTPENLRMVKKTNAADDWTYQGTASVTTVNAGIYEHWVQQSGLTTFSYFALGGKFSENPLPIELMSFTANPDGNKIKLKWQTASEYNNNYFVIFRADESLQFLEIGAVPAVGNSSTLQNYSFVDLYPIPSNNYYKLRQTDVDGIFTESSIVFVPFQMQGINATKVGETLYLTFPFLEEQEVYYQIFTLEGVVTQKGNLRAKLGQRIEIQLNYRTEGVFFISLTGNFNPVTFKMHKN